MKKGLVAPIIVALIVLLTVFIKVEMPSIKEKVKEVSSENMEGSKQSDDKEDVVKKGEKRDIPYRNVLYYGDWSIYQGQKCYYPSRIDGSMVTHLNFAFLDMDENGDLVLCDEHADFQATLPEQEGLTYGDPYAGVLGSMSILRTKYPNMKIGISVGGWTRSGDFSVVAADKDKRENFAKNIALFVDYLGFDFVDIDWEYPTDNRESDPEGNGVTIDEGHKGTEEDGKNFTLLMEAIRKELDLLGEQNGKYYELSAAMSANPEKMKQIEYDKVLDTVDFLNMMTYDLNGAWNPYTAHQTALYTNDAYDKDKQKEGVHSIDNCIQYLKDTYGNKIDYSKIVVGVAPYTRAWAGVKKDGRDKKNPGLYATAEPNSVKSSDGTLSGTYAYSDIETLKTQYQLKEYYDEKAEAAYYYSEETGYFFTCDNERSTAAKGEYVKKNGLGGLISWMASLDANGTVLKTMKESLYGEDEIPAQEIHVNNPDISLAISGEGSSYNITITNNEKAVETNAALKLAELYKKTVLNPKLYIKSKSGATFKAGMESGDVINEDGYTIVDLSSVYNAKTLKPGTSHTFTINTSGTADVEDIEGVSMTQRILISLDESGQQNIYGNNVQKNNKQEKKEKNKDEQDKELEKEEKKIEETETTKGSSYDEWGEGKTYTLGNLVSYKGKVFECIFAHTSQIDWAPDKVPTLWKERTELKNVVSSTKKNEKKKDKQDDIKMNNNYYVNSKLPKHFVTGYWHNFVNGSTNLKLSDVPEYYDLICVAFTGNTATPGEVTFTIDPQLSSALGGYSKKEFIKDIKELKANGQHVIVSVGGEAGRIEINSKEAANLFANGLIQIIEEYGFEGVDIDLEGSAVSGVEYIGDALRRVHDHFGDDFIITMAPETYYIQAGSLSQASSDLTTSYLRLAINIKDILTVCYPQFYNSGGMIGYGGMMVNPGNADFLTALSTSLIEEGGLRPDQVAIGVPSMEKAAGSGYVDTATVEKAFDAMINGSSSGSFQVPKKYPEFRGVMTWSINWDATQNYKWGKAMAKAVDEVSD